MKMLVNKLILQIRTLNRFNDLVFFSNFRIKIKFTSLSFKMINCTIAMLMLFLILESLKIDETYSKEQNKFIYIQDYDSLMAGSENRLQLVVCALLILEILNQNKIISTIKNDKLISVRTLIFCTKFVLKKVLIDFIEKKLIKKNNNLFLANHLHFN